MISSIDARSCDKRSFIFKNNKELHDNKHHAEPKNRKLKKIKESRACNMIGWKPHRMRKGSATKPGASQALNN
jgi:hypothetical protein